MVGSQQNEHATFRSLIAFRQKPSYSSQVSFICRGRESLLKVRRQCCKDSGRELNVLHISLSSRWHRPQVHRNMGRRAVRLTLHVTACAECAHLQALSTPMIMLTPCRPSGVWAVWAYAVSRHGAARWGSHGRGGRGQVTLRTRLEVRSQTRGIRVSRRLVVTLRIWCSARPCTVPARDAQTLAVALCP